MTQTLKQYIDLYKEAGETINRLSPEPLNRPRAAALATVTDGALPRKGDEGYERTSVDDMFAPDYGINCSRMEWDLAALGQFRCEVANFSPLQAYLAGDTFIATPQLASRLPEGVTFCSLRRYAEENPGFVERYYATLAPADNTGVALNTLLAMDGAVIRIARGVKATKPLQLVNLFCSEAPMMAVRRLLIVVEEDASAQVLICDHTLPGAGSSLSSSVAEIFMERGSHLEFLDMEESTPATSRFSQVYVRQEEGSELRLHSMTLSSGTTRNEYDITLAGQRCSTMLSGMAIGSERRHTDNNTVVRHNSPLCHSTQLFKYVLDETSTGAFGGSIIVAHGSHGTEAYQSNRNILASKGSRMHTRPQLEIYNDDVKCSHGATTGQLDEEALFYMRTRGIPAAEARVMLMQAFMTDVIDTVNIEGLRDRLRHLVEQRFAGVNNNCDNCKLGKK